MPPTVKRGNILSVTDTTNIKLDVSDVIDQLSPEEVPILDLIGKDSLKTPCDQLEHQWLEDELRPRSGTLAAAYTAGSGTIILAAGQGQYLVSDDLVIVGDNVMRVESGPGADTLQITAGLGDSNDTNQANGSTWRKLGHAAQEAGVARTDAAKTVIVKPSNFTQIFKDWTMVSGTMQAIQRYGYASEWSYQIEKVLKQLAIDMELNLVYGVKTAANGPPRKSTMGGLFQYIFLPGVANAWNTVQNLAGGELTEITLNNALQRIWEVGGMPDTIFVNGFNKRKISGWATPRIRTTRDERTAGNYVTTYESDFGDLDIYKDRWLRPSDVLVLTKDEIGIGPLNGRQFSSRELPVTGDFKWYEILGEYTMEVHKGATAHGWIYNTATA